MNRNPMRNKQSMFMMMCSLVVAFTTVAFAASGAAPPNADPKIGTATALTLAFPKGEGNGGSACKDRTADYFGAGKSFYNVDLLEDMKANCVEAENPQMNMYTIMSTNSNAELARKFKPNAQFALLGWFDSDSCKENELNWVDGFLVGECTRHYLLQVEASTEGMEIWQKTTCSKTGECEFASYSDDKCTQLHPRELSGWQTKATPQTCGEDSTKLLAVVKTDKNGVLVDKNGKPFNVPMPTTPAYRYFVTRTYSDAKTDANGNRVKGSGTLVARNVYLQSTFYQTQEELSVKYKSQSMTLYSETKLSLAHAKASDDIDFADVRKTFNPSPALLRSKMGLNDTSASKILVLTQTMPKYCSVTNYVAAAAHVHPSMLGKSEEDAHCFQMDSLPQYAKIWITEPKEPAIDYKFFNNRECSGDDQNIEVMSVQGEAALVGETQVATTDGEVALSEVKNDYSCVSLLSAKWL